MKFYITTDTHFGHQTLVTKHNCRPDGFEFKILKHIRNTVGEGDVLIHLGDVAFNNSKFWMRKLLSLTEGVKLWLIRGNHDKNSYGHYIDIGFDFVADELRLNRMGFDILFTHVPATDRSDFDINIHGHMHLNRHRDIETSSKHLLISLEANNYMAESLDSILKQLRKK